MIANNVPKSLKQVEQPLLSSTGNKLKTFPDDRIDVLASMLNIDLTNNRIKDFPSDFPYLYRLETVKARYS